MAIGTLAVNIIARTEKFTKNISRAGRTTKLFTATIKHATRVVATFGAAAAAAGVGVTALMVKSQLKAVDATSKLSDRLGITTEKLVGLQHAAEIYGVSQEGLNVGMRDLVRRLGEAAGGSGEALATLNELGLSAKRLVRLDADEAFVRVAAAISKIETQAERAAAAYDIFGRRGVDLLNLLQAGGPEIRRQIQDAHNLGKTFTREMGAAVERANDAITRLKGAFTGLFRQFTIFASPLIEGGVNKLTDFFTDSGRVRRWGKAAADAVVWLVGKILDGVQAMREAFADMKVAMQDVIAVLSDFKKVPVLGTGVGVGAGVAAATGKNQTSLDLANKHAEDIRNDHLGDRFRRFVANAIPQRDQGSPLSRAELTGTSLDPSSLEAKAARVLAFRKKLLNAPISLLQKTIDSVGSVATKTSPHLAALGGTLNRLEKDARQAAFSDLLSQLTLGFFGKRANSKLLPAGLPAVATRLTLAQAGSAESFRQRRAIERQGSPAHKLAVKQHNEQKLARQALERIERKGGGELAPANIRG